MTHLKTGDTAPDFKLSDQNNQEVKLSDYKGKKVLIYFYPKAMTPGCTVQSCEVRDAKNSLNEKGVVAIGISPDPPSKLKKFEEKQELNFSLLSDENHLTAEAYGVWGEKKMYGKTYMGIIRSSFLINEEGLITEAWYKVSPKNTIPYAMEIIT